MAQEPASGNRPRRAAPSGQVSRSSLRRNAVERLRVGEMRADQRAQRVDGGNGRFGGAIGNPGRPVPQGSAYREALKSQSLGVRQQRERDVGDEITGAN